MAFRSLIALGALRSAIAYCLLSKQRIDERGDSRTRSKDNQAPQKNNADNNGQEPKLFPLSHKRPKL
jgi:hypothetical protein